MSGAVNIEDAGAGIGKRVKSRLLDNAQGRASFQTAQRHGSL